MPELIPNMLNWFTKFVKEINKIKRIFPSAIKLNKPFYKTMITEMLGALLIPSIKVKNYKLMPLNNRTKSLIMQIVGTLSNITELTLSRGQVYITSIEIEDNIMYLNKLKKFEYKYGCTNGIIMVLGEHCKKLRELNFRWSKKVGTLCIKDLLKLTKLRNIDLPNSNITIYGYIKLLKNLKLEKICWFSTIDEILDLVPQRNLNRITSISCYTNNPTLLVRKLPRITELTLHNADTDMSALGKMSSLKVFNLIACYYKKIKFAHSIARLGEHLVELRLFGIIELRFTDIIFSCKVLKTLEIDTCQFHANSDVDVRSELPHFESLESLKLVNCGHTDEYVNLFGHYAALQRLHVQKVKAFSDMILDDAITSGRLNNLRELIVENCDFTNSKHVISAIKHSTHLQTFGNLQKMKCFEGEHGEGIKRDVRATTLDLTLISEADDYICTNMSSYRF
ncbi:hypothetical protein L9F63_016535 [Diploptera punctata]|uniref:Uncharacterized protein n=1 Tax=Diploptera punctata TaxID=6984 RepID=A0AAD8A143_DIPPU|nr:hypothetical protein L9F63_016535 [Diploptera punctata]